MPIRFGQLFDEVISLDALYRGYLAARRLKRKKKPIQRFEENLGAELLALEAELQAGTYAPGPYRVFWVNEPKPRLIYAPQFRDVVVQHAIYARIYPIFDRSFVFDSYGCRVGKGNHAAADRLQRYLRAADPTSYTLQLDIRKFFYRIDRDILMRQIEAKIKDRRLLALIRLFMAYPDPTGVPIGNLMSQLFSNVCLNALDHYIKRELKVRRYVRFVDDLVIVGVGCDQAHVLRRQIEAFLAENLHLELSRWRVAPVARGVNFVGYRTWRQTRFVRKHSLHTFSRRLQQGRIPNLVSILAHARHTGSFAHMTQRIQRERPDLIPHFPQKLQPLLEAA